MSKIDPFEQYPERYDRWFEQHAEAYRSELHAVRELLPPGEGIEIGVGTGRFAEPLEIPYGVEPSIQMALMAQRRRIHVIAGVAEALPLRDSQFSTALMVTTVCFLDDREMAFKEIYRILKPEGIFVLGFIEKNSPIGKMYLSRREKNGFYADATFYTVDDLLSSLRQCGFTAFKTVQTLVHRSPTTIEPVKDGYGEGSFVVIGAKKP
jgi:SAM-dependent methyltransferase